MPSYVIVRECAEGSQTFADYVFDDDDAAISYVLPLASGACLSVWRGSTLIANVDERPCLAPSRAA